MKVVGELHTKLLSVIVISSDFQRGIYMCDLVVTLAESLL